MSDVKSTQHLSEAGCADLVLGTLTGTELDAALAHVRACPQCEERLRLHTAVSARAQVSATRQFGASAPARRVLGRPGRPWIWAAAAVLVAALALPRLIPPPVREPQRWLPTPDSGLTLREGESDPHLAAGLAAYARRDLPLARRELEAARVTGGAETARRLYLANTLLALDEPESALTLLQGIDLLNVPEPWQEEALWSLQVVYRRSGQDGRADSLERARAERAEPTP